MTAAPGPQVQTLRVGGSPTQSACFSNVCLPAAELITLLMVPQCLCFYSEPAGAMPEIERSSYR